MTHFGIRNGEKVTVYVMEKDSEGGNIIRGTLMWDNGAVLQIETAENIVNISVDKVLLIVRPKDEPPKTAPLKNAITNR